MSRNLAIDLCTLGGLLAATCGALLNVYPDFGRNTLISGIVAGAICIVLGLQGTFGSGNGKLAAFVLILISLLLVLRTSLAVVRFLRGEMGPLEVIWCTVFLIYSTYLAKAIYQEGK